MPSEMRSFERKKRKSVVESSAMTRKTFLMRRLKASRALEQKFFP